MSGLPRGWVEATIRDLCELINGKAFKPSDWTTEGLPIVRIQNLNNPNSTFNYYQGLVEEKFLIEDGQLLFAWSGTPGTSFGAHVWNGGRAVLNQHIFKVNFPFDLINKHFLRNAINQKLEELIGKAHGGAGLQHVTKGKFEETLISLPPLAEQKRIVAKLDALNAKSARARIELARIETLVSRYKQAVLDYLCDVSHSTLSLRDLVDQKRGIPYGIVQTGKPVIDGVPTVRCGDIKNYTIRKAELKLVDRQIAQQYGRTVLVGGEVLIAIRGSIGETCVADKDLAGCNISREVAMIPLLPGTSPQFVMYFLKSNKAKEFIGANTKGSAQQGINLGDLRNLPIPSLRLEEQHEIVRRIESAFAKIDRLAKEAKRALELLGRLDEAILAKAFRGELVPQDENDEPAERLLARIRAERDKAPKGKRGRGAKG